MHFKTIITGAAAAGLLGAVATAQAATVYIGGNTTGAIPVTDIASGNPAATAAVIGAFDFNVLSGQAPIDPSFSSNSINFSSNGGGTAYIFISDVGVTKPIGSSGLSIGLTENTLPKGWTVTEKLFADAGNGKYAETTQLASFTFNAPSTQTVFAPVNFAGPFSLTAEYIVTAPEGAGSNTVSANSTINVSGVPEPSTWAMLLVGFGALGFAGYRRQRAGFAKA